MSVDGFGTESSPSNDFMASPLARFDGLQTALNDAIAAAAELNSVDNRATLEAVRTHNAWAFEQVIRDIIDDSEALDRTGERIATLLMSADTERQEFLRTLCPEQQFIPYEQPLAHLSQELAEELGDCATGAEIEVYIKDVCDAHRESMNNDIHDLLTPPDDQPSRFSDKCLQTAREVRPVQAITVAAAVALGSVAFQFLKTKKLH